MSISITITDPTNEEALRIADYLYELAGFGKSITPTEPDPTATSRLVEVFRNSPGFVSEAAPVVPIPVENQMPLIAPAASVTPETHDIDGVAWNAEIHASTKSKTADGRWRAKRNTTGAAPAAPAAPVAPSGAMTFPQLMQRITQGIASNAFTHDKVKAALALAGCESLPALASQPNLIPVVCANLAIAA